ncbi:methyltransferase [Niveispirillum sp.]|uniref:class I SAM-dependent methyltransferase n=1 Tax=Niveispirillum sp. TaxID=1917217 RepID=UPI001B4C3AE5|nr:methyltransferase [Niveispirillum sp.]MBP7335216.1 class I SAM-dependent methyltransferase [Niveispirillum sp.]
MSSLKMMSLLLAAAISLPLSTVQAVEAPADQVANVPLPDLLAPILAGEQRSDANKARDAWRHPVETLDFFGVEPGMTVVEIWPGGGWYTEVLGPLLNANGRYIAAGADPNGASAGTLAGIQRFKDKLAADPSRYSNTQVVAFGPKALDFVPAGSVDRVLTFRNVHNWMGAGWSEDAFKAMFKALKPGGVLGVVEHRANKDQPQDPKAASGYVREDHVIKLATDAGFKLVAMSEINSNPRDTKDHPKGVWTLPPTLSLKDQDRDKYLAIGESDRMTLRFVKPAT